jgi:hypothetical protein
MQVSHELSANMVSGNAMSPRGSQWLDTRSLGQESGSIIVCLLFCGDAKSVSFRYVYSKIPFIEIIIHQFKSFLYIEGEISS